MSKRIRLPWEIFLLCGYHASRRQNCPHDVIWCPLLMVLVGVEITPPALYGFSVRVFAFYWVIWDKLGGGMAWMPQPSRVYDRKLIQNVLINPKGGTTRHIFLE